MNVLVTGGAGFIGSAYVRHRLETHPEFSVRVLDKLTYAGRRENLQGLDPERLELVVADIVDAEAVKAALDGCDAIVNFAAETHVDRSITAPGRVHPDRRLRHLRPARGRPRGRRQAPADLHRRGLRLDRGGLVHRELADRPLVALLGLEGGRRHDGRRLPQHLRHRGADRPRLEQLRPAPVPGEADPALHPQRPRRRPAARLRRRDAGPQLALGRRTSRARSTPCSSSASRARSTTSAGPTSSPTSRSCKRILELTGRDESLIEYVDRPPRPRPPLLARLGEDRGARLERRGRLRRGDRAHGRVVSRERVVVAADPLGRVPRVLRAPVRVHAGLMPKRLETRLDGPRPARARRCTATSAASWSRRSAPTPGASSGVDAEFVQDNHSRSRAGILRGLHFQTAPGQAKLVRCLRGRIWDVAVDLRRDSPTYGSGRATSSTTSATASSSSRSASRTASACSPRSPTSTTSSRATTTPRPRPGSPGTTPRSAVEWPLADPQVSERDATAPRLAEIAAQSAVW